MTQARIATFFGALMLFSLCSLAQPRERIKQIKIAYLTERVALSSEDAQAFWPIYNAYVKEMEALKSEGKNRLLEAKAQFDSMSDEEVADLSDNFLAYKRRELAIREKYHPKFKAVLSPRQMVKFYRAEEQFGIWILRQFQNKRKGGGGR